MKKFGLIGDSLSHSYSKIIHEFFYKKYNIDATYELINTTSDKLKDLVDLIRSEEYVGFNVTKPFKTEIMKYIDIYSPGAFECNACNTIFFSNGAVCAYNTDIYGFDFLINYNKISLKDVFVLGSGGASKSVCSVLDSKNINYKVISRQNDIFNYDYICNNINGYSVVNTTPIGMYPNVNETILPKEVASKANVIIDLIYNPSETLLMSYNKNSYSGLEMLVYQAAKSFEIWNGIKVDIDTINELIKNLEVM